jgi:hypothetical protein
MNKDKEILKLLNKEYKEGLTIITPTGDREECLYRCNHYIRQQTYTGPIQWIIIDDSIKQSLYRINYYNSYHHLEYPGNKAKSINRNIRAALEFVQYNKIAIIEDDDCYRPDYLEILLTRLDKFDLAGEGSTKYYNIKTCQYRQNHNTIHASLFQTGLKTIPAIEHLYVSTLREQSSFIDSRLWNKKLKKFVFCDDTTAIGIKGMEGRPGIGIGHRPTSAFQNDRDFKKLRQWMQKFPTEYLDFYIDYHKGLKCVS